MPRKTASTAEIVDVLAETTDRTTDVDPPAQVDESPPVVVETPAALSPEQLRIKELEDQLALERGRKDPEPELEQPKAGEDNIVIHVVAEAGFTVLGEVWFRGQEMAFNRNGQSYRDTCDRHGQSWLLLDESAQVDRYGEVMFRQGPWPGKSYTDAKGLTLTHPLKDMKTGESLSAPTQQQLERAAIQERKRARATPRLPTR